MQLWHFERKIFSLCCRFNSVVTLSYWAYCIWISTTTWIKVLRPRIGEKTRTKWDKGDKWNKTRLNNRKDIMQCRMKKKRANKTRPMKKIQKNHNHCLCDINSHQNYYVLRPAKQYSHLKLMAHLLLMLKLWMIRFFFHFCGFCG